MSLDKDPRLARDVAEIARKLARAERRLDIVERSPQLRFTSGTGTQAVFDDDGNKRQIIGAQIDGTYTAIDVNAPPPPAPTSPVLIAAPGGIVVIWDGSFAGGVPRPLDMWHVEVHVGPASGYIPTNDTQVTAFPSVNGGEFLYSTTADAGPMYVLLVAVNTSIVESIPSAEVFASALPIVTQSDGFVPAQVVGAAADGGIKSVFLSWTPVVNSDPVKYKIYGSTASGFPVDATHKLGETAGTRFTAYQVWDTPNSAVTQTFPSINYYFRIVAEDEDGPGAASAEFTSTPTQVTGPDIAVNTVTTDHLQANAVTADKLEAVMALLSEIHVGQIEIHPTRGITIPQTGTEDVTRFASDGSGNQFAGGITANDGLTSYGGVNMQGTDNFLAGELKAGSGVNNPGQAPTVTTSYEVVDIGASASGYLVKGLTMDSTLGAYIKATTLFNGTTIQYYDANTGAGITFWTVLSGWSGVGGITRIGSGASAYYYVLCRQNAAPSNWKYLVYDVNGTYQTSYFTGGAAAPTGSIAPTAYPAVGTDGTNVMIAWPQSGRLYYRKFQPHTGTVPGQQVGNTIDSGGWGGSTDVQGIQQVGAYVYAGYANGVNIQAYSPGSTTATPVPAQYWPKNTGALNGFYHDGAVWRSYTAGRYVTKHTNNSGRYLFAYDWTDADSGGSGTASTMPSPTRDMTPTKFAQWTVTVPSSPPDDLTSDGANTARIFISPFGSPLVSQTRLVTNGDGVTGTPLSLSVTYNSISPTDVVGPANSSNDFSNPGRSGAIGRFSSSKAVSGVPIWHHDGDGSGKSGPLAWNSDGGPESFTSGIFTAAAGWTLNSQNVVRYGKFISIYLTATRSGAAISMTSSGDVANTDVATGAAGWAPSVVTPLGSGLSGRGFFPYIFTNGAIGIAAASGTTNIATGEVITLGGVYIATP